MLFRSPSSSSNPYEWITEEDGTGLCRLKNGSYCLPTIIQDVYCNPYTSRKILYNSGENGYQWRCVCKYPTSFNQDLGSIGDCNKMELCGMMGSSENPAPSGRGIYRVDEEGNSYGCVYDSDCSTGDKCINGNCFWQPGSPTKIGSNWDPMKPYSNGMSQYQCQCGPEEIPDGKGNCIPQLCPGGRQKCVSISSGAPVDTCSYSQTSCPDGYLRRGLDGSCPPGTTPSQEYCECADGFIDCLDIAYTPNTATGQAYYNGACSVPSCIPDPCEPYGKFDPQTRNCICNTGYDIMLTPYTVFGQKCVNLCGDELNPCGITGQDVRGDCYIDKTVSQLFTISKITYNDQSDPYFFVRFPSSTTTYRYVVVDESDNSLKISGDFPTTNAIPTNGMFKLKPYCDPTLQYDNSTCPLIVGSISLNDSYFFMYKSTTTNNDKYIDWIGKKVLTDPVDPKALSSDPKTFPTTNWPSLIKFVNLDTKTLEQQKKVGIKYINSTIMDCYFYMSNQNSYIDVSSDKNSLTTKQISLTAKCGRSLTDGIKSTNPLVCKDGYFIGGKNRDMCINPKYCRGFHIQDTNNLCNNSPSANSYYSWGDAYCEIKGGGNNCGIDNYPVCDLSGTSCTQHCEPIPSWVKTINSIADYIDARRQLNVGEEKGLSYNYYCQGTGAIKQLYDDYDSYCPSGVYNQRWCPSWSPSDNSYIPL